MLDETRNPAGTFPSCPGQCGERPRAHSAEYHTSFAYSRPRILDSKRHNYGMVTGSLAIAAVLPPAAVAAAVDLLSSSRAGPL